ncbi:MAG TPA: 3D domain-containing protein [Desulfosalsimonadaceae bacterium]|nr:3D domain-containing protein [Desulfosalsimonadaceae bacterium]
MRKTLLQGLAIACVVGALVQLSGCGHRGRTVRNMEVTAYCGCGECCNWERGSWKCLKLDIWNRYIREGKYAGEPYSGLTASGTKPHEPQPGLFSLDSLTHPWMVPFRLVFPWLWLPEDGTIAADTRYYPFGTRIYVPNYGYGVVEDRGGAIKGPKRLDLFYDSHSDALEWGRRHVDVKIY